MNFARFLEEVQPRAGAGLGFGPCAHYGDVDPNGKPIASERPASNSTLFTLLSDGRMQNVKTGCLLRCCSTTMERKKYPQQLEK